ncbi:hypothetical protein CXB49_00195 [Chromobacterium sp. ATCC 53434]|uniref:DUF6508 domain-containing protein n=1 Tax=Chromobacterium sp. (strain ATCC 53434 / SC 14030) TaxID=2059672 RepID=UPI000C77A3A2|nr:DUF6508 domain-containing protein [Chromobacterium sp. ATCC 53434]AUH49368.1 hypothetical protein CXB49_00195 [Chromobacterium sp. ATCC 53434]
MVNLNEINKEDLGYILGWASPKPSLAPRLGTTTATTDISDMQLLQAMDTRQFFIQFDWRTEFSDGADPRLSDINLIDNADLILLRKIMTAHVRMDRFIGNHLEHLMLSGYWARCMGRLQQLHDAMS